MVAIAYEFLVEGEDSELLDACVELEPGSIVLQSRGGTKGLDGTKNQDYSRALRVVLTRLYASRRQITGAWVDSSRVQSIPLDERRILAKQDFPITPEKAFTLMGRRMEAVGQLRSADPSKGNRSKRIRIALSGGSVAEIAATIQARPKQDVPRSALRLPERDFSPVNAVHIWNAAQAIVGGEVEQTFGDSAEFDVIIEGKRFPPKWVFGIAATDALGFVVGPAQFSSGFGKPAFDKLTAAGFSIVSKDTAVDIDEIPIAQEDREWAEGNPALRWHLTKERARGLAPAKKAAFLTEHGRLYCERCTLDPIELFGDGDGVACIEVHHDATSLADINTGHRTRLSDVRCLCANCHRYIHRVLKRKIQEENPVTG